MIEFERELVASFGADRVQKAVSLVRFTTFRVGGPAEWLIQTRTSGEIVTAIELAARWQVPVTMLGGGSNVLVADEGIRGLVIRPRGGQIVRVSDVLVRADAAVTVNGLVRWTIMNGAAALEAWAGTPGTVGGAIFGNAHFGGRFIGELVDSALLASRHGATAEASGEELGFGYDRSRLQSTREILLSATFRVSPDAPTRLRAVARASLAYRKRTQPLDTPSAGCVFRNPEPGRDRVPDGIPCSAGALVDRAGLKGLCIGGARVSPTHGTFIVNDGSATAADVRQLIARCQAAVRAQFGVELREEIVHLGESDVDTVD
jgi:UDP-N-acetylmuramate dehydrogenase